MMSPLGTIPQDTPSNAGVYDHAESAADGRADADSRSQLGV
jgi:hypothetical protein